MANELIINASLPETRIALMENGEIQDLLIERASGKGIVGNIYKGRVTRVLPGMQAAFVDIGLEKAAFLYVDDVYVHSEIWEEEEGTDRKNPMQEVEGVSAGIVPVGAAGAEQNTESSVSTEGSEMGVQSGATPDEHHPEALEHLADIRGEQEDEGESEDGDSDPEDASEEDSDDGDEDFSDGDEDDDEDEEDDEPADMGPEGDDGDSGDNAGNRVPGTITPRSEPLSESKSDSSPSENASSGSGGDSQPQAAGASDASGPAGPEGEGPGRRRHRRGRRGGRFRNRRGRDGENQEGQEGNAGGNPSPIKAGQSPMGAGEDGPIGNDLPESYNEQVSDGDHFESDRSMLSHEQGGGHAGTSERPEIPRPGITPRAEGQQGSGRQEFKAQRSRDRRIKTRTSMRPPRAQVNIQDLLKEGQEVLVQVAKDPIATKGARLTCHISLPGRHLVCMPTIDHVGVSRRIERDDERRRLREYVEKARPRGLGFIVRTASGKHSSEQRIKQDVDYLARLWDEIREKAANSTAPALVYEDLNSVLRAIRDWVTEEIDKIIVDSRYHYNDILRFVSHFMPSLKQKVELYHGDIPIFDAYAISTELSRALERKVWLKSGGYLVIDQAEALVAIDVNTGRYVGKKNLEDTILKTNLEAVQEIAYQLRLRNCGGIIILDLIDMEREENKQRVYRALEEALKKDRARPSILKISELGLVEMTRKRTRDTMVRALCESCSHCEGKGFIKSKTTVAYEVLREIERTGIERDVNKILVQANPDVIDILAIDERETLDQIERRQHRQVYLQAVGDMHPEQFEVSSDKKVSEKGEQRIESREGRDTRGRGGRDRQERGGGDRNRGGRKDRDAGREQRRDRGPERSPDQPSRGIIPVAAQNREGQPGIIVSAAPLVSAVAPQAGESLADLDSIGNQHFSSNGIQAPTGDPSGNVPQRGDDDFFENEEDRLAFLRAQAAQDAALARLNSGQGSPTGANRSGMGGGRGRPGHGGGGQGGPGGDRGGRNNNRRRRGGKFRGPRSDRPQFGGRGNGGGGFGRGGEGGGAPPSEGGGGSMSGGGGGGDGGGDGDAGPSGGGAGTSGGGGDHSQPPT